MPLQSCYHKQPQTEIEDKDGLSKYTNMEDEALPVKSDKLTPLDHDYLAGPAKLE